MVPISLWRAKRGASWSVHAHQGGHEGGYMQDDSCISRQHLMPRTLESEGANSGTDEHTWSRTRESLNTMAKVFSAGRAVISTGNKKHGK